MTTQEVQFLIFLCIPIVTGIGLAGLLGWIISETITK
mgnify:CR=1 FL=1